MDIKQAIRNEGIECVRVIIASQTEFVCHGTTPDKVNDVLRNIGVFSEYRAFYDNEEKAVYVNRLFLNGKSWD